MILAGLLVRLGGRGEEGHSKGQHEDLLIDLSDGTEIFLGIFPDKTFYKPDSHDSNFF